MGEIVCTNCGVLAAMAMTEDASTAFDEDTTGKDADDSTIDTAAAGPSGGATTTKAQVEVRQERSVAYRALLKLRDSTKLPEAVVDKAMTLVKQYTKRMEDANRSKMEPYKLGPACFLVAAATLRYPIPVHEIVNYRLHPGLTTRTLQEAQRRVILELELDAALREANATVHYDAARLYVERLQAPALWIGALGYMIAALDDMIVDAPSTASGAVGANVSLLGNLSPPARVGACLYLLDTSRLSGTELSLPPLPPPTASSGAAPTIGAAATDDERLRRAARVVRESVDEVQRGVRAISTEQLTALLRTVKARLPTFAPPDATPPPQTLVGSKRPRGDA